jgi:hypothetical protein
VDRLEESRGFTREITELDEDILLSLGILILAVDVSENREISIQSLAIVLLKVSIQDESSLLDKE